MKLSKQIKLEPNIAISPSESRFRRITLTNILPSQITVMYLKAHRQARETSQFATFEYIEVVTKSL